MKKLVLNIPDSLDIDEKEAKAIFAASIYENCKLSLGQAAEMAGYPKKAFMDILGNFHVSLFNDDQLSLENDIANAQRYNI